MTSRANDFVKSWNDLNTLLKSLTSYDVTTKPAALTGDQTVSGMQQQLRNVLFSSPAGARQLIRGFPTSASRWKPMAL